MGQDKYLNDIISAFGERSKSGRPRAMPGAFPTAAPTRSEFVAHAEAGDAHLRRRPGEARRGREAGRRSYGALAAREVVIEIFDAEQQAEAGERRPFEAATRDPAARRVVELSAGRVGNAVIEIPGVLDLAPGAAAGAVQHQVRPDEIAEAATQRGGPFHLRIHCHR